MLEGDKLTTSVIAKKAGIPVGSIYRYFPNILGIYRRLFEEINGELREGIAQVFENANEEKKWQVLFQEILMQAVHIYTRHPAYGHLLMAMTNPALQCVRQNCIEETSKIFAKRWHAGLDGFKGGDPDEVARTASKLFTFLEECYFEQLKDGSQSAIFQEIVKALQAYLSLYLEA